MEEFPSNSQKAPVGPPRPEKPASPPEKKVEKVTTGEVVRRKKSLGKKLKETFVGGDAKSVWGYVTLEVLLPAAKDMIADAVSQGIERMIFGEARSTSRRTGARPSGPNGYVSYQRYSSSGSNYRDEPRQMSRRARAAHDFDEIVLPTRAEADTVLERLYDLVNQYGSASVGDFYELSGVSSNFADQKYGWTELRRTDVVRVRNGYVLDLPKPEALD